jgi:hypothetical protein
LFIYLFVSLKIIIGMRRKLPDFVSKLKLVEGIQAMLSNSSLLTHLSNSSSINHHHPTLAQAPITLEAS